MKRLAAALSIAALLTGCGAPPIAGAPRPARAPAARAVEPALAAALLRVEAEGGHHAVVTGAAGAVRGMGVWGSPGAHDEPANGEEAAAAADGGFALELHAHPGERITLWAFVDEGGRRIYSRPLVLDVPAGR